MSDATMSQDSQDTDTTNAPKVKRAPRGPQRIEHSKAIVNYAKMRGMTDLTRAGKLFRARLRASFPTIVKMDGKNLLDSPYEVTQGSVQREYYRAGRVVSLGLTWRQ